MTVSLWSQTNVIERWCNKVKAGYAPGFFAFSLNLNYQFVDVLTSTSEVVSARKRSASIAAMQPVPAAVTAWR